MIANILIGVGAFLLGGITGMLWEAAVIRMVNVRYKEKTGNDFIQWIYDEENKHATHLCFI